MELKGSVDKKELAELARTMDKFNKHTEKSLDGLLLKVAKLIGRSAALWTKPSPGKNVKRLPNKDRLRPIEKIPESEGYWYTWAAKGADVAGKLFRSKFDISQRSKEINPKKRKRRSSRLTRITHGWKFWNRDTQRWGWIPRPGKAKKWDGTSKRGRIPSAGAARWGWMKIFADLSKKSAPGWDIRNRSKASKLTMSTLYIKMSNMVSYISKIGKGVANTAVRKATNSLRGELKAKFKKDMKRKIR